MKPHTLAAYCKSTIICFVLLCSFQAAFAQGNVDIGEDITICSGRTGTVPLTIQNISELSTELPAPTRYMWLLLTGGSYAVLKDEVINSFADIEEYSFEVEGLTGDVSIRLVI